MGEYLSPILEGFSSPTMDTIFKDMLKTSTLTNVDGNINFLRGLLEQQSDLAISLLSSANRLYPYTNKKSSADSAYDAAFESDVTAPLPNISGTLQGFTLFFFTLSYFCLAIVFSININQLTGNTMHAVYSFIGFLIIFIMSLSLINRFG
jgi:hypothetical protein